MRELRELRDRRPNEIIYVVGAGGTLNYLDPAFFADKITIGVNRLALHWPVLPTYIVTKYHELADENAARFADVPIVVPKYQYGNRTQRILSSDYPNIFAFDHVTNHGDKFDAMRHWPEGEDDLVVSWSTITTAMHLAAYVGASTIMMVGHDCGQLGDQAYLESYGAGLVSKKWFTTIEAQSIGVKKQLIERYGVRVYSLSPFINYNLEGVPFVGANRINSPRRRTPSITAATDPSATPVSE